MKFVVVNHRTPLCRSTCRHCSRAFGASYLRDVSTQKPFCDYDCYRRYQADRLFMPWLAGTDAMSDSATNHAASLRLMASLAACWGYAIPLSTVSLSLLQAALGFGQLMTAEAVPARRPG